jgi:hypothetical protein
VSQLSERDGLQGKKIKTSIYRILWGNILSKLIGIFNLKRPIANKWVVLRRVNDKRECRGIKWDLTFI